MSLCLGIATAERVLHVDLACFHVGHPSSCNMHGIGFEPAIFCIQVYSTEPPGSSFHCKTIARTAI